MYCRRSKVNLFREGVVMRGFRTTSAAFFGLVAWVLFAGSFAGTGARAGDPPAEGGGLGSLRVRTVAPSAERRALTFLNGDVNGDRARDVSDPSYLLSHLFLGGPPPVLLACAPEFAAVENGDANGDGDLDLSDGIHLLSWLFSSGPEPVEACGPAPSGSGAGGAVAVSAATGSAMNTFDGEKRAIAFSALEHADGTVTGESQHESRVFGFRSHVSIDCLAFVDDRTVIFSGVITKDSEPEFVGRLALYGARDNGDGPGALPDEITGQFPDIDCETVLFLIESGLVDPDVALVPIEEGSIDVRP